MDDFDEDDDVHADGGGGAPSSGLVGWRLYFPLDDDSANDPKLPTIHALIDWFTTEEPRRDFIEAQMKDLEVCNRLTLNLKTARFEGCPMKEFLPFLWDQPFVLIPCLCISIHQVLLNMNVDFEIWKINVRIVNFEPLTPLRHLKANYVEKFVSLRGNVVRVGKIKPMVTSIAFECDQCGESTTRYFPDGRYDPPNGCVNRSCKNRFVLPDRKSATTIDWQKIRVQEIVGSDEADAGRIPRTIECDITEDLVDTVIPGDLVTISGIVRAVKSETKGGGRNNQNRSLFVLYLDVNSIINAKFGNDRGKSNILHFSESDLHLVREVRREPNLLRLLVHSLCPTIFGHEVVKVGLLLTLFGGAPRGSSDSQPKNSYISIRSDPHMLIVGDPGLGKSQLLTAVSQVAPRGVFVCGNTASSSGLTVTLVRESGSSDFALEAGALVLADQGVLCIDEFDKMSSQHSALLEAMEQQSVSIAKAGIVASLGARTSVIAAANPVGGHYNKAKTVNENLKTSPALLSRFDLIFILLDTPDERRDEMLSKHVLELHAGKAVRKDPNPFSQRSSNTVWHGRQDAIEGQLGHSVPGWENEQPLTQRLLLSPSEKRNFDALPRPLLRKYIAYARKYVHPRLTTEAKRVLQDFYLNLRKNYQSTEMTPITTRQLESMIRLAEARARMELREVVTGQDANDVVEIMKESLYDTFSDEFGTVDFRRTKGMSKGKQAQMFVKQLHRSAQLKQSPVFSRTELRDLCRQMNLDVDDFDQFLESLNLRNQLLKMRGNKYRIQSYSQ